MTDHQYRTLPRFANSDLSELAAKLFGKPAIKAKPETLQFGSNFHTIILEPHKSRTVFETASYEDIAMLNNMGASVERDKELMAMIEGSQKEVVRQWVDPVTNLPLKAKIDAIVQPRSVHLIDLKTTSCTSLQRFLDSCYDYDYTRQAAFYLSSDVNARFFSLIGVQKVEPYNLYKLDFHRSSDFVKRGMKQMNMLLASAKETGFVPSSWSRIEETVQP